MLPAPHDGIVQIDNGWQAAEELTRNGRFAQTGQAEGSKGNVQKEGERAWRGTLTVARLTSSSTRTKGPMTTQLNSVELHMSSSAVSLLPLGSRC